MTKAMYCKPIMPVEDKSQISISSSEDIVSMDGENVKSFLFDNPGTDTEHLPSPVLIGLCVGTDHPVLKGRCLIRWTDSSGNPNQKWLPCIKDVSPEIHDRVVLQQPGNWFEPLISGIIDGFCAQKNREFKPGPAITLEKKKSLHVLDSEGTPLLQIDQGDHGPVLHLLNDDLDIDVKGRLRLTARDIQLTARNGGMKIQAADDVEVKGEIIYLN